MVNLEKVSGFDWDEGNSRKIVVKHDVTQAEAEQIFLNEPLVLAEDETHSGGENRFHALGQTDDRRRLLVAFTLRGEETLIRVVSAKDMNRKERARYEQEA